MVIDLSATLDDDGTILEWRHEAWSHPHTARPGLVDGNAFLGPTLWQADAPEPVLNPMAMPRGGMLRNSLPLYEVGHLGVDGHFVRDAPVRTSALRALGAHPNVFAIESFMDELAEAAGVDPVEFRLRHLSDERARGVIEAVVERAGVPVGGQSEEGHGFGIGFARYKNTSCYVAVIAEVEAEQEIRLVRAWAALDAGHVVNPDGAANQIEGGMLQSASWALKERISFDGDLVASRSWLDYPILTFSEVPELDVVVLDRPGDPALGVGEGSQGPMTAAIGNAVHAALGVRVRDLPLTPDRVMKAILG
jgi:nicotinate dehydrogenase subunit B